MGPAGAAPQDDLTPLRLQLRLFHRQSMYLASGACIDREERGEIVKAERVLSKEGIVEAYRASRMVLVLAGRLVDACSGSGSGHAVGVLILSRLRVGVRGCARRLGVAGRYGPG